MTTHQTLTIEYDPEFVCTVRDESIGLTGYLVVDASLAGHACGGLRLSEGVSIEELGSLARSMTLKYGFSYMKQGGAKAGIVADPDLPLEKRRRLLYRFGELLGPVLRQGYYYSGPDMNTTEEDIEHMLQGAGVHLPHPRRGKGKKSGLYTALAVMVAAEAAASAMETSLQGKTIAIEGFGAVGSPLAMLMAKKKGVKVLAVSTTKGAVYNPAGLDVERLLKLRQSHGNSLVTVYEDADRIDNEELLTLDVDIISPCARQWAITEANADRIKASLVCPGANNPVTPEAERMLFRRKIVSVPHFTANCGGVLGNKLEVVGVNEEYIESFIRKRNFDRIRSLIVRARDGSEPMTFIAEREAKRVFDKMREEARHATLPSLTHRVGLRVFNAGLIPDFMIRPLAPRYLERTMRLPSHTFPGQVGSVV